jgi:peptide-methionine (S)-S-oxide reductase
MSELNANQTGAGREIATLGGGCFWCLEAVYTDLQGVLRVESGYAGGDQANPSYQAVCTGSTGHAEVVQITFDPAVTTYRELLEVYFSVHNPTTLNRQGADIGTQYRSVIFYHSPEQKRLAEEMIQELTREAVFAAPLVTELSPYTAFYPADGYHHDYYRRNPAQGYCQAVIAPKLTKFRQRFAEKLKR